MGRKAKNAPLKDGRVLRYDTIKARLFPTPEQAELFEKTFGCCRWIWNHMLSDQQRFYSETDAHFIPTPAKYKKEAPFLTEVDNQALTQEHNRLAQAFRVFFKNPEVFGPPKFKRKKDDRDTFSACNTFWDGGATIYTTRNAIRMTKAGAVRATFPRRARSGWKLTRVTVEKTRTGKYYAYLLYEYPVRAPEAVTPTEETTLGLKYSLSHFYVTDSGAAADPPRWLHRSSQKLAELQRKLCRMQAGSENYEETVRKYRLLHEHIANQRKDFIHKETRRIANEWDAVCVRDDRLTAIAGAVKGGAGSGYGMFRETLRYKLERQGKAMLTVERYCPTTKTCSVCGCVNDTLDARAARWTCPACGARLRREVNAAVNIKAQGLAQLRAESSA